MTENETYLVFRRAFSHWWILYTWPVGPVEDDRDRAFTLVDALFDAFADLVAPTQITYTAYESEKRSILSKDIETMSTRCRENWRAATGFLQRRSLKNAGSA